MKEIGKKILDNIWLTQKIPFRELSFIAEKACGKKIEVHKSHEDGFLSFWLHVNQSSLESLHQKKKSDYSSLDRWLSLPLLWDKKSFCRLFLPWQIVGIHQYQAVFQGFWDEFSHSLVVPLTCLPEVWKSLHEGKEVFVPVVTSHSSEFQAWICFQDEIEEHPFARGQVYSTLKNPKFLAGFCGGFRVRIIDKKTICVPHKNGTLIKPLKPEVAFQHWPKIVDAYFLSYHGFSFHVFLQNLPLLIQKWKNDLEKFSESFSERFKTKISAEEFCNKVSYLFETCQIKVPVLPSDPYLNVYLEGRNKHHDVPFLPSLAKLSWLTLSALNRNRIHEEEWKQNLQSIESPEIKEEAEFLRSIFISLPSKNVFEEIEKKFNPTEPIPHEWFFIHSLRKFLLLHSQLPDNSQKGNGEFEICMAYYGNFWRYFLVRNILRPEKFEKYKEIFQTIPPPVRLFHAISTSKNYPNYKWQSFVMKALCGIDSSLDLEEKEIYYSRNNFSLAIDNCSTAKYKNHYSYDFIFSKGIWVYQKNGRCGFLRNVLDWSLERGKEKKKVASCLFSWSSKDFSGHFSVGIGRDNVICDNESAVKFFEEPQNLETARNFYAWAKWAEALGLNGHQMEALLTSVQYWNESRDWFEVFSLLPPKNLKEFLPLKGICNLLKKEIKCENDELFLSSICSFSSLARIGKLLKMRNIIYSQCQKPDHYMVIYVPHVHSPLVTYKI